MIRSIVWLSSKKYNNVYYSFFKGLPLLYVTTATSIFPPPKNTFSINVELTSTFFTLQRFGPSPSLNYNYCILPFLLISPLATTNQDMYAHMQKPSRILPITLYKLNLTCGYSLNNFNTADHAPLTL